MTSTPILSLDIGGTTSVAAIFSTTPTLSNLSSPIITFSEPTQKGRVGLITTLHHLIKQVTQYCHHHRISLLPVAGVGCPGKLSGTPPIIAPGSAQNLELFPCEMDHFNLEEVLLPLMPTIRHWVIRNDALAQMTGGLMEIITQHPEQWTTQKVGYIGPGTGLGGGFGTWYSNELIPATDGHIYDICCGPLFLPCIRAEDRLSGRAFETLAGFPASQAHTQFEQAKPILLEMGKTLSELILTITQGTIRKQLQNNQWAQADCEAVKGTTHFILGGSLGKKGFFGDFLLETAQIYLKKTTIPFVFYQIIDPKLAALRGAATWTLTK